MDRKNKYHAVKVTVDGVTFDSKAEAARYAMLRQQQSCGIIRDLELQPAFPIFIDGKPLRIPTTRGKGKQVTPRMDFRYVVTATGETIVEDRKGMDTPISRLKRALVEHTYGIKISVVKG